jgi:hypothetical protein
MRFSFVPFPITTQDKVEYIRLMLMKPGNMDCRVTLRWERKANTEWDHAVIEENYLAEAGSVGSTISSIWRFLEEEKIDVNDPNALITINQKNHGEMYVKNASGQLIRVSDIDKNGDADEYQTNVPGMKKRFQCFASSEAEAQAAVAKLMINKALEDQSIYDDLAVWGKAGRPMRKIEKKDSVKVPDLNAYCKRGETRAAITGRFKKKEQA